MGNIKKILSDSVSYFGKFVGNSGGQVLILRKKVKILEKLLKFQAETSRISQEIRRRIFSKVQKIYVNPNKFFLLRF